MSSLPKDSNLKNISQEQQPQIVANPVKPITQLQKKNLLNSIFVDIFSAYAASFCVAPFIAVIDRAVIENASGKLPLWQNFRGLMKSFFTKPHKFVRRPEFLWIWWVYSSTYLAANISESICVNKDVNPLYPKFLATFFVNTAASIVKDRKLTIIFGLVSAKNSFPLPSYLLFLIRDIVTIMFAFSLPGIVGDWISKGTGASLAQGVNIAQLSLPLVVQFLSTPMHLLGLDYYNRPASTTPQRFDFLKQESMKSIQIRWLRFFPAYGIGGVGNIYIRDGLANYALKKQ